MFGIQPSVAVLDASGQVALNFVGSAYVQVSSSPSGFEILYLGSCDYTTCGTPVVGSIATANFVNGIAQFSVSIHTL